MVVLSSAFMVEIMLRGHLYVMRRHIGLKSRCYNLLYQCVDQHDRCDLRMVGTVNEL